MKKTLLIMTIALFSLGAIARSGTSELRYQTDFGWVPESALKTHILYVLNEVTYAPNGLASHYLDTYQDRLFILDLRSTYNPFAYAIDALKETDKYVVVFELDGIEHKCSFQIGPVKNLYKIWEHKGAVYNCSFSTQERISWFDIEDVVQ